ncbi:hypothetical protein ACFPTY_10180 [Halomonas beimenensis]|uniref:Uncharacterized protein n=1 Tax=Halomonas beimenensis TaxID=475662 RepID=A0A291P930_9GAMM|nr:hypothetical protein [Halomonas beimenensis]ATJ83379.1 hypothetical protein BEI_2392 [Halomonas beimenensis]
MCDLSVRQICSNLSNIADGFFEDEESQDKVVGIRGDDGREELAKKLRVHINKGNYKIKGSEESRENAIGVFLDVILLSYTFDALRKVDGDELVMVFVNWLRVLEHRTVDETKEIVMKSAFSSPASTIFINK